MKLKRIRMIRPFKPAQFLAVSFIAAILLGTGLLMLPISPRSGHISFIDALFTSTSAVCVTGLTVHDTAGHFSSFGQGIILMLFQIGGLGVMTFSTLILLVARKRISIQDRLIIKEGYHHTAPRNVRTLIKNVFLYTFIIEGVGALLLFPRFLGRFSLLEACNHAVFHSISAFCNAGFSLFNDSFISFRGDVAINLILVFLIISGGLGFLVLQESFDGLHHLRRKERIHFSMHAKLVLSATGFLILSGFLLFLAVEWNNSLRGFGSGEKLLAALFQVVTPRTAGFNTMDLTGLSLAGEFVLIVLMFIGASPGSTGGGIKTTTAGVIFAFLRSRLAARESVSLFQRTLSGESITKAYTVTTLGICVITAAAFILFLAHPGADMKVIFFEVFSAFGTVGLSLGFTPELNSIGKLVIILTMYIGRIGPLALLLAFSRHSSPGRYEYVEEEVMIG